MKITNIGMLVSGTGRTLENMAEACKKGDVPARIVGVVSSKPGVFALKRAERLGIPYKVVSPKEFPDPKVLGEKTFSFLEECGAEWVLFGGYIHYIIVPEKYQNKVLNIHPALIPCFCGKGMYGDKVHKAVLERGVRITGVTVHFVDDKYDHGPIVLQEPVPVEYNDTVETLSERVFETEKRIYPKALKLLLEGKLVLKEGKVIPGDL